MASHKNRHVRAECQPGLRQIIKPEPEFPEMIKAEQSRGRIGASAAEPAAYRKALGDAYGYARQLA